MIDWLMIWGVTQAAGLVFAPILQDLAKEGAKEYGKEFFKNSLSKVLRLPEKDAQIEAYGKALKAFLDIFQQQLEMADVSEDGLKDYQKPLKTFIHHETVKPILGDAFNIDCQVLDTFTLANTWQNLNLKPLPTQFNWEKVGKFYLRKIKEIIKNSDKLSAIFTVEAKQKDSQTLQEIAGVKTDYDLDNYAEGLKQEYGYLKLESLDTTTYEQVKLWKMFVPQKVRRCLEFIPQLEELPKERRQELLDRGEITQAELELQALEPNRQRYFNEQLLPVLELVNGETSRKLVFLGDPGAGKSSLLQYLALNWAEKEPGDRASLLLPLLIELRIYARDKQEKKCKDFLEFFHQGNLFCHLNQHPLHEKLKKGQIIALFDGLDEVFEPNLRAEILTDIKRFSIDYPDVKILVTSRWLGYKAEELRNAEFEHFMIQDLDKDQIADFIQRWHDLAFKNREDKTLKKERLQKAITESKAIRELAGNPLLLTMMAILNRTQELPRDRPKLYEKASDILLHQWDFETKEGLTDPELKKYLYNIDLQDKKTILRLVANEMQTQEKGLAANLIYGEDLERILSQYLESTGIGKRDANDLTDLIIKQLRYRHFILCLLGGNTFAFVHRTFLEYFCACHFYERFKKRGLEGGITLEELKIEVFSQHWSDSSWHEVLRLIIGMLSADFPKEIAEELINYLIDQESADHYFKNIFLAVDCFSELRNPSAYPDLSQRLLENLKSLAELDRIMISMNYKAMSKIATVWQDDNKALSFMQELAQQDNWIAMNVLAQYWQEDRQTLPLIQQLAQQGNKGAIDVLAKCWQEDRQTLPILQQLAQQGNDKAIDVLAKYWREDGQTLSILQQLAQQGNETAIKVLLKYWREDRQTLPILQQLAQQGKKRAIGVLAYYWQEDRQTLPIIQQLAQQGNKRAIDVLAQYWRKDRQTLPILQQLAQQGNWRAMDVLAQYWREDRQTLPIIQQLAQQGDWRAMDVLAQYWREDRETLPIIQQLAQRGNEGAIELLARYWQEDRQTLPILQQLAQKADKRAIYLLARYWPEDERAIKVLAKYWQENRQTLPILQQQARKGNERAIELLAEYWREDRETLPIIQQLAQQSHERAIELLAEYWLGDRQTFPLIQRHAQKGNSSALEVLAEYWQEDRETLPLIQRHAQKGNGSAIIGLAKYWRKDRQTLPIIQQLAQKGNYIAINVLTEYWQEDRGTLPIIQQLAQEGNKTAIYLLARYWGKDGYDNG